MPDNTLSITTTHEVEYREDGALVIVSIYATRKGCPTLRIGLRHIRVFDSEFTPYDFSGDYQ